MTIKTISKVKSPKSSCASTIISFHGWMIVKASFVLFQHCITMFFATLSTQVLVSDDNM